MSQKYLDVFDGKQRITFNKHFYNTNIDFIDINDQKKALKADLFMDELHLDERGNKIIAEIVAAYIKTNNLIAMTTKM